jgi:2-polyprenyl-3-methyl-5-hydroxy-6-metoxy-1,4-benzoquinol methylase
VPVWTGAGFLIDGRLEPVLAYGSDASGWSDELTEMHDETSGGRHFIDVASRQHTIAQLDRHLQSAAHPFVLEVGCSGGYLLGDMASAMPQATIVGADYTLGNLRSLHTSFPRTPLVQFDLTRCPLPSESFDAVVLLNVLEHIRDDGMAVQQSARLLRPRGILVIEVPAGPELFDGYDAFLQHHRRYSMPLLEEICKDAGLKTLSKSHLGFMLYPPFWAAKKFRRMLRRDHNADNSQMVRQSITATQKANALGTTLMRIEAALRRMAYLPFGIRCLLTAQKA